MSHEVTHATRCHSSCCIMCYLCVRRYTLPHKKTLNTASESVWRITYCVVVLRRTMYLLTAWAPLTLFLSLSASTPKRVKVFHFTIDYWRLSVEGPHDCGSDIVCEWTHSSDMKHLRRSFRNSTTSSHSVQLPDDDHDKLITVSVYNIHSWLEKQREYGPATCELPSTLTIAESEESRVRYHKLFDPSFKLFDGFSTTHPSSSITRVYESAYLNASQFINEGMMHNFSTLIKAAAYVAGDCHKRDNANSNRDAVVLKIRKAGFRVEGLGKCLHTVNPEGTFRQKLKTSESVEVHHLTVTQVQLSQCTLFQLCVTSRSGKIPYEIGILCHFLFAVSDILL